MKQRWRMRLAVVAASAAALGTTTTLGAQAQATDHRAAAAHGVGALSVAVASGTAGATDATYTIGFTATTAIAAGGTISLQGPTGTYWPSNQETTDYALTDADNVGGDYSVSGLAYAEPGQQVFNFLNNSGAIVSMLVHDAVAAGDHLTLVVSGVQNPAAGTDTLEVSTSGDPDPVTSPSYSIGAASSVAALSVAVTAPSEGSSAATYAIGFTPATTVAVGGTVTLVGPPGTLWPGTHDAASYTVHDPAHPAEDFAASHVSAAGSGAGVHNFLDTAGSVVTVTVPGVIRAGDAVTLTVDGVHNTGAGSHTLTLATSSDSVPATSSAFVLSSQASVGTPAVTTTSSTGLATGVTYGITVTTPVALPVNGEITVTAPPGTVFPADRSDYTVTDTTTSTPVGLVGPLVTVDDGAGFAATVNDAVAAGDQFAVSVTGVMNPGAGSQTLAVSTSTAPAPATSAAYAITGVGGQFSRVSDASLAMSSSAGGVSDVTDTVTFTTSASGAIAANTGTITLTAPPGTIFESCPYGCDFGNADYTLSDANGSHEVSPALAADGSTVQVSPTVDLPGNDVVTLSISQVTNQPAGAGTMTIATSGDRAPTSVTDTTHAASGVTAASLSRTSAAAGAARVTDTVDFTTSATGRLVGGLATINLFAGAGAIFDSCGGGCDDGNADVSLVDHTTSSGTDANSDDFTGLEAGPDNIISIVVPHTVAAGDHVTLTITRTENPLLGSGDTLGVSTSSDTVQASLSAPVTAPVTVLNQSLRVSSSVAGATGTTYTLGFTTSATGAMPAGAPVNVAVAAGTDLSSLVSGSIEDLTHPAASGDLALGHVVAQGTAVSATLPHDVSAGDHVIVVLRGVTNGPAGAGAVTVSTGADSVRVSQPLTFAAGHTISGQVMLHDGSVADGAEVQVCTAALDCDTATTDAGGDFSFTEVPGTYALTANPPAGVQNGVGSTSVALAGAAVTGVVVTLGGPPAPAAGITLTSPSFGSEGSGGGAAVVNWNEPTEMTVDPSVFPAGKIRFTQVVINGTDATTGLPASKVVAVGGSINGAPIGVTVGSSPIQVTIPALRPLHGEITTRLNYVDATNSSPPPGMTSTQILDLIYPNAPPDEQPTDPLPAYFYNYAYPAGQAVTGPATITGADSAFFSIHKLSSFKVPAGPQDCGNQKQTLDQYDKQTPEAPPSTFCGVLVSFDPPPNDTRIYYRAKLVLPVGTTGDTISSDLLGCDSDVADESQFTACDIGVQGDAPDDDEEPPPDPPDPTPGPHGTDGGGAFVDPSGTVLGSLGGTTVPLAGATVTLSRSADAASPPLTVASGSAVLSPGTPVNPETTTSQGAYGWDVLAGYYDVSASATDCTQQQVGPLVVPPPATGVDITLACTALPSRSSSSTSLHAAGSTVGFGKPLSLHATVTGATSGAVAIKDGTTTLAQPALVGGAATYDAGFLSPGVHHLTATYSGDAGHEPSTSSPVTVTVTATRAPTTLHGKPAVAVRHSVVLTGHAALGATVSLFQATNRGRFHRVARLVASKQTGVFHVSRRITAAGRFYASATGTRSATLHVGTTPTLAVRRGHGHKVTVSGVAPVGSRVVLDRRSKGHYVVVKATKASRTTGHYRMTVVVARRAELSVVADRLRSKQRRA